VIKKGEKIGIIGKTGSGKSTMLDLLMGLLEPLSGEILVDNKNINNFLNPELMASWRLTISHVPQNVFLINATIAENIAFGIPKSEIDMDKVRKVSKQAFLSNFIESTEDGYYSITGERGVKLSGGQRQRIGIARALYKDVNILVFDEATSALDNETELAIINSIENIDKEITLLFIAHRYSSLKNCDRILEIKNGGVASEGSFESLKDK
jgi:ATP-binding cassette subfamily B protein